MKILYEINENGAYSNIALNKYLSQAELRDIDRAFATELVYGSVKWKLTLDRVLAAYSNIKPEKLSPWIRNILRLGTYQLLKLTKVPKSAACNESVKLAGRYGHKASAGYVNAVLRNIARNGGDIAVPSPESDPTGYLSVKYSYPKWLVEKFTDLFGVVFTESLLDAGNSNPELTIRANTIKTNAAELMRMLAEEGVETAPGKYAEEAVIIRGTVSIARLETFKKGYFQVQDESSMLPAKVLAPEPGQCVLDACSAPGGKATHLAQLMQNRGSVIARDIHEHKLKLIEDSASRLGLDIIRTELHDAAIPDTPAIYPTAAENGMNGNGQEPAGGYDRVLLDAPCTGLGIIRRKPDIKWARETRDIDNITALQRRLIQSVSTNVRPGGVFVYSTCTLLPEENDETVKNFLAQNTDFEEDEIDPFLPAELRSYARGGMLQLYPNRDGIDGFFIARLKRKEI